MGNYGCFLGTIMRLKGEVTGSPQYLLVVFWVDGSPHDIFIS